MDAIFGMEFPLLVKFVISFVIVLMLIGAAAFLVRRFGSKALTVSAQRNRQPRLAVVDTAPLDSRRSLVIVRRDNVEHLLLIGGPTDLLVEPNITPAAMQTTRDADSMTRPPAAAVLPAPNWAPGNAGWPAAGATDMAARFEPAQKAIIVQVEQHHLDQEPRRGADILLRVEPPVHLGDKGHADRVFVCGVAHDGKLYPDPAGRDQDRSRRVSRRRAPNDTLERCLKLRIPGWPRQAFRPARRSRHRGRCCAARA